MTATKARAMQLHELGERRFIEEVARARSADHALSPNVLLSIGDDAAVVEPPGADQRIVITVDAFVEATHFRRAMRADAVGYRLAVANLSDLAAMGAAPSVGVLTFGAPPDLELDWAREFFAGIAEASRRFGFDLVGGDTVRCECIVASLTLIGFLPREVALPCRANAQPGDRLFATGTPGESAAGLRLELSREFADKMDVAAAEHLAARHFRATPRLAAGAALARAFERLALVDISDGIFNETELLCEASGGLGAEIEWRRLPTSAALDEFEKQTQLAPQHLALFGGEDFELLFAADATLDEVNAILRAEEAGVTAAEIGRIVARPAGVRIIDERGETMEIDPETFEHFG